MHQFVFVLVIVMLVLLFAVAVLIHPRVRGKATTPGALYDKVVAPIPKVMRYETRGGLVLTADVIGQDDEGRVALRRRGHPHSSVFFRKIKKAG